MRKSRGTAFSISYYCLFIAIQQLKFIMVLLLQCYVSSAPKTKQTHLSDITMIISWPKQVPFYNIRLFLRHC